jgi:effector-binding domain-containing protein
MRKKHVIYFVAFFLFSTSLIMNPAECCASDIVIKEITPFSYACIPHKGPFTDMEQVIGMLIQAMQNQNLFPPTGPMIGIYYNSPAQVSPQELTWEMGFPVAEQAMPLAPLEKKQWSFTTVAVCLHVGPFEETEKTIIKMTEWMQANGYFPSGPIMERYLDMDPSKVKPEELKTEIWFPCTQIKK